MQKLSWLLETFPKYLIAAIIMIVPLFPKFPLLNIPGTYVAIRFEDLLLLILAVLVFIKILPNIQSFLKDKIVVAFLIFFGVGLISVISGVYLTHTVGITIGMLHWLRRIEYAIPFFAGLIFFTKETISENLNFYLKLLVIVVIVAFVYGLGQRYLSFPIIITQNAEYSKGIALRWTPGSHINSTFAGHYDLAAVMVMLLPIFITLLFVLKDKLSRLILLATSSAGLWLLINSVSRIAQVSYLLAVCLSLLLVKKFKALGIVMVISLVLITTSSDLGARFGRIFEVVYKRLISSISITVMAADKILPTPTPVPVFEDRSTSIRLNVEWPRATRAFSKNPILGTGYSSIGLATDNDYLRILAETGILGFFAFWLIFIRIGKVFLSAFPLTQKFSGIELGFISGVIGAVAGTFLTAVFIDILEASKFATLFWLLLGYAVFLIRSKKYV